jgi:hypothetical protein
MPKFRITVYREWTEHGEIKINAANEDDAREQAENALLNGDEGIDWFSSNMDPGDQGVDSVEESL